ncbi:hypothetical protein HanRHA438_Chr02g0064291 [Helianthus annuus]|nr:hypothetical protein HanRHA438_Chr02g0064291 [Helianthus annuus]
MCEDSMKTPSTSEGESVGALTSADYVFHRVLKLNRSDMARKPRIACLYRVLLFVTRLGPLMCQSCLGSLLCHV